MSWRHALWGGLILIALVLFAPTRMLLIRVLLLPAGLHWVALIGAAVLVLISALVLRRRAQRQAARERVRDLERDLGLHVDD